MHAKFVTIEGCEGVGKSTQIKMLKAYTAQNNIPAVFVREPGGTSISEQIRQVILAPQNTMDATAELLLYSAARCQLNAEVILPSLKNGCLVICDRYIDSTTAYQGYARGLSLKTVQQVNQICLQNFKIDLTIFLDLDPLSGFKRKGGADKRDRLDSESLLFHQKVYQGYKEIARLNSRVASIDASCTADEVFNKILQEFKLRGVL